MTWTVGALEVCERNLVKSRVPTTYKSEKPKLNMFDAEILWWANVF